ncbi:MAG: DUF3108 domain-containing protein [Chloroflexi bacterium]|nr:MAG: DUF3108 domain-containing protein [Chloroflexota bacterium]
MRRGRWLRAASMIAVVAGAVLLTGCQGATPNVKTSDIFVAAPWKASERLEYRLRNSDGQDVGTGVLTTRLEGDRVVLGQSYTEAMTPVGAPPVRDEVTVTVDAKSFKPVQGTRMTNGRTEDGKAQVTRTTWTYRTEGDKTRLATSSERDGGKSSTGELTLRPHFYDNESSLWFWRGIAFAEQYEHAYVSANAIDRTQQNVAVRIPQRETIEVPAGKFDTWRILVRNGRAVRTAWISSTPPHLIVRWDNADLIFELTKFE